jgi:hypothetical protein
MELPNLGLNDESIKYEVALDVIGSKKQPFVQARYDEEKKENPSQILIDYYTNRLRALDDLREELDPNDKEIIYKLLSGEMLVDNDGI